MSINTQKKVLPVNYKSAFQLADIRGKYDDEINEGLAFVVGYAFVQQFSLKKIIVGRDMRLSSASLSESFIDGARCAGSDVVDIGLSTTPMLYFVSGTENLAGVMVTASHSPKDYNGLKLVLAGAVPLTAKTGLTAIKNSVKAVPLYGLAKIGTLKKKSVYQAYKKSVLAKTDYKPSVKMKVVGDAGNGMGSLLDSILSSYKKLSLKKLFFSLDGTFPNHASNPTIAKNQKAIIAELKKGGYDFGFAFDGDADRVAFFDEKGRYVNASHIGALLAEHYLTVDKKRKFVYTVLSSQIYKETIERLGGKAVIARVGHSFIKEVMRKQKVFFGCEHSAHFFYQDYFYADSVIVTVIKVMELFEKAKKQGLTFSQMMKPYTLYYQTEDFMIDVADKTSVMLVVKKWIEDSSVDYREFDGISFLQNDCMVVIKPSVTESAINVVVESKNKKSAEEVRRKVVSFIQSIL